MSSTPVLLLFGAGANTGLATARKFAKEGYKVAAVSRHPSAELKEAADLIVPADLTDPSTVETVFEEVTKKLGTPHVVVYNAYDGHLVPVDNPLIIPAARMTEILAVSAVSAYTAASLAVKGWATLPASASKTYIYTGNMENTQLFPAVFALGMGKNAATYFIETAASAYPKAGKDYKFYYVDERGDDGESVMLNIDGEAHALEFWKLAHKIEGQSHWAWTFVKGDVAKGEDGKYVRARAFVDKEYRGGGIANTPADGLSYGELFVGLQSGTLKWEDKS